MLCMQNFQSKNLAWVSCIRTKFPDVCIFQSTRVIPKEWYKTVNNFAKQKEQEFISRGRFFHTAKDSKTAGQPIVPTPIQNLWSKIEMLLHDTLWTSQRVNLLCATIIPTYFLVTMKSTRYFDWISSLSSTAISLMDKILDAKHITDLREDEHVSLCLLLIRLYSALYRFKLWVSSIPSVSAQPL
jgi:hypothetical protein